MKMLLTGGTGFIGSAFCQRQQAAGHDLTVLTRDRSRAARRLGPTVTAVDSFSSLPAAGGYDVVVNLAGAPIADRPWTARRKQLLRDSRIRTTRSLLDYLSACEHPPGLLVSASAVGYYGDQGGRLLDETADPVGDFAHELCRDWEAEAFKAEALGIRVGILRLGLVVGRGGGIVKKMSLPFRLGLGGPLGSGEQWMSWVHREDVLGIIDYLIAHETLRGVFNATAPNPVTNQEFSRQLAARYHRPAFFRAPAFVLRLGLGEMSALLLGGQRVLPARIREAGYAFRYTQIDAALADACRH